MSEGIGLIRGAIGSYKDFKIKLIQRMADTGSAISENTFLDDGYINSKIEQLKGEYKVLSDELNMLNYDQIIDSYKMGKTKYIKNRQINICIEISILASNSFSNLPKCLELIKGIDTDFTECIEGLSLYYNHREEDAFKKFYDYFNNNKFLLEHYLINRVYGELLFKSKQYELAKLFLQKAIQKRPDDIECHKILRELYKAIGDNTAGAVEDSIIVLLNQ